MCTALVDLSLCQRQKHLNELAICDNFNGDGNSFRSSQVLVHNNSDHNTLTQRTVECACTLETLLLINCSWSPRTKCNLQYTKKYYTMYTRKDTVYGSNVKNYSSLVTHSLTLTHTHTHTHGTFTTPWHWKTLHCIRRYSSLWPTYLIPFLYLSLVRRLSESITFAAYGYDVIGRVIFSRFCNSIEIYSTWATHDVVYTPRFSLCYLPGCLVLTRFMNYFTVFYQLQLLVRW